MSELLGPLKGVVASSTISVSSPPVRTRMKFSPPPGSSPGPSGAQRASLTPLAHTERAGLPGASGPVQQSLLPPLEIPRISDILSANLSAESSENNGNGNEEGEREVLPFEDNVEVGECKNIRDVLVPKQMENNVSMGHAKMDILMSGDGATPSCACLVTGIPGSGKTTAALQLADAIMGTGNIALYNTCEESLVQVSRVSKRLRLQHGFYVSSHRSVFDVIAHANTVQQTFPDKQVFLFVDSLQTIDVPNFEYSLEEGKILLDDQGVPIKRKGRVIGEQTMQVEATRLFTTWCKKTYGILFLIGQVNKDGDFAGRQKIKHWVDAHLHLGINTERHSPEYGQRIAEMTKNRFGCAHVYFPFEIEARGIKFLEPKKKK